MSIAVEPSTNDLFTRRRKVRPVDCAKVGFFGPFGDGPGGSSTCGRGCRSSQLRPRDDATLVVSLTFSHDPPRHGRLVVHIGVDDVFLSDARQFVGAIGSKDLE
jgi:hypothetical protein